MNPVQGLFKQRRYLLLALLLLCAQTAALAHTYEHNAEAPASTTCSACVTATQLASVCVGKPIGTMLPVLCSPSCRQLNPAATPAYKFPARQRGPPQPL